MGRILGNGVNDGPRDRNNPARANEPAITDPQDPKFLEQQQPEIDWMKALLDQIRNSRNAK